MARTTYQQAQERAAEDRRTLGSAFLAAVKRGPRSLALTEVRGQMSRLRLAAVALSLEPMLGLADEEKTVGVLLPPGLGGSLINVALTLSGRVPINLNHTVGEAQLARMCDLADIRTVVSARAYLERIEDPSKALEAIPVRVMMAEDLIPRLSKAKVIWNMLRVLVLPPERLDKAETAGLATIIFSSGTTGDPKGIQLSHRQILFNCDAVMEHLSIRPGVDVLASPLPLFHSFGLIPGLWMPLIAGLAVAHQADPRDGKAIGKLVARSGATILISTPTFVRGYMRRIEPEQLESLRFAIVGAEHCPQDLRLAFRERYGAELLEGYGCTELAPAVAVNTPEALRDGSVGRPLPGIEILTISAETGEPLPEGEEGLLVVRSPGRMTGYVKRPDLTEAAFVGDGYNTGDVGHVDADGFIHITGRLARFAKVAGEMVPLDTIEDAMRDWLSEHYGEEAGGSVAVSAVHSKRRGERLLVLHTPAFPCKPDELLSGLQDLPALFKPRAKHFYPVDEIPILGTGKRDLGGIKKLAEQVTQKPGVLERIRGG